MNKQQVTLMKNIWVRGSQALLEGVLKLPEGMEEISSILDVSAFAEIDGQEVAEDRMSADGTARFTVLYMSKKGNIDSFETECKFKHSVAEEGVMPSMGITASAEVQEINFRCTDGVSVTVRAELNIDLTCSENQDVEVLSVSGLPECVEARSSEMLLPLMRSERQTKAYISTELRVPQSMPPVQRILLCRGYTSPKTIESEEGRIIVEGDLRVFVVYLSADKNAPLQYFSETVSFGEIVSDPECTSGTDVTADARLERLSADVSTDNEDILCISAVASLTTSCRDVVKAELIEDMYARGHSAELSIMPINTCVPKLLEPQKKVLRLGIDIPESAPEAARVLYTYARPEIVSVQREQERLFIDGVMHFLICYTTSDSGIKSTRASVPFETEMSSGSAVGTCQVYANCEYTSTEGSGRELEAKCCLDFTMYDCRNCGYSVVADANLIPEPSPDPPGIVVYFSDGRETGWDIAKRFRVRKNSIGDDSEPLLRGTKVVLIR